MSWIDIAWPLMAGVSLTLGLVHVAVWVRERTQPALLMFGLAGGAVTVLTILELLLLHARTPAAYMAVLRWVHLPTAVLALALAGFVLLHFRAGRPWLAFAAVGLRLATVIPVIVAGESLRFRVVTAVQHVDYWGVPVAVPIGIANPWAIVAELGDLALVAYLASAIIDVHRRSRDHAERRRVALVCGSMIAFVVIATTWSTLVGVGVLHLPLTLILPFLGVLAAMTYEMGGNVVRATRLERQLEQSETILRGTEQRLQRTASERLRTEREIALQRDQLAHLSRISVLGEMSGSLAHELNQPLTAVLSNAQAALRFLDRDPPDLGEVRESLVQIVENDKRAGEVIRRLRAMLRKEQSDHQALQPNELVHDVLRLIHSDLLNRNVATVLDLAPGLPPVLGDRVQLQQVLLNLVVNACEAMERMPGGRIVRLHTRLSQEAGVEMLVRDAGPGIPPDDVERIFAPFFTSKSQGMGLGLAVCRTIVQSHHGQLWASNAPGGGAVLHLRLPPCLAMREQAAPA